MSSSITAGSGEMFDAIADRYDLLNRIISFGVDQRWRRRTVDALALGEGATVLDLATGTADLAMRIARRHPDARVIGVDPSRGMLERGQSKLTASGLAERVRLELGDAQALSLEDDSVDGVCIAFGIRNVPDRDLALSEMARVARPGARIAILELSEPRSGILGPLARFHVHRVVPTVGGWLSGAAEYRYLQRSIEAFPPAEEFARQMERAGIREVQTRSLTFGVCTLYVGIAP